MEDNKVRPTTDYTEDTLTLEQVKELKGRCLLEFGAPWCENCQAAKVIIHKVLNEHLELPHIKIYDGKGKSLGRVFKVKLWPTLILLHDGNEIGNTVLIGCIF